MLQTLRYHYKNLETLNVFWADREVVKTWGRRTATRPRGVRISWPASSASQVRRVTAHQHLWGGFFAESLHQIICYLNNSFVLLDAYNSEFNLNKIIGNPRSVSHKGPLADLFFVLINNLYRFDWLFHTFEMEFHHLLARIDLYKTAFSYSKIFIFIPLKGHGHDFD